MEGLIAPLKTQSPTGEPGQDRPSSGPKNETENDLPDFTSLLLSVLETGPATGEMSGQETLPAGGGQWNEGGCAGQDLRKHFPDETIKPERMPSQSEDDPSVFAADSLPEETSSAQGGFENAETAVFLQGDRTRIGGLEVGHAWMQEADGGMPTWLQPGPTGSTDSVQLPQSPVNGNTSTAVVHSPISLTKSREGGTVEPAVDPNHLLEQVSGKIISFIRRGGGGGRPEEQVMRISLHPESLGRIEVRISMTDDQVSASVVTETEMAKELIDSQHQSLRSALLDHGLKMEGLTVAVGHQPSHGNRPFTSQSNAFTDQGQRESGREREGHHSLPTPWDQNMTWYDIPGRVNLFA